MLAITGIGQVTTAQVLVVSAPSTSDSGSPAAFPETVTSIVTPPWVTDTPTETSKFIVRWPMNPVGRFVVFSTRNLFEISLLSCMNVS